MKRRNPNPDCVSDDNGSTSDDNKRLQRRRPQLELTGNHDDAVNVDASRLDGSEHEVTAPGNGQGLAISIHSLDSIGENVYLPDYVRQHNSTLTFPEKVCAFVVIFCLSLVRLR
jgi:hypothetical protein